MAATATARKQATAKRAVGPIKKSATTSKVARTSKRTDKSATVVDEPPSESTVATEQAMEEQVETESEHEEEHEEEEEDVTELLDCNVDLSDGRKLQLRALLDDVVDCLAFVCYPKASTSGCTKQVNAFNTTNEEFKRLGVQVLGISLDSMSAQVKHYIIARTAEVPVTFPSVLRSCRRNSRRSRT